MIKDGVKVRVVMRNSREYRREGVVRGYDGDTGLYLVLLDDGPPWRGFYLGSEIEEVGDED